MKATKKEIKRNLLKKRKNKQASFISLDFDETEKFKYNSKRKKSKYIKRKFIVLKTFCNKIIQVPQLWMQKIDFKAIRDDTSIWFVEVLVEGFIVNFVVWALLGLDFNLITMLAWGFAIKQLLSIYWRLKKDGSNTTIPTKNK